jgi:hypothetical protein
MAGPDWWSAMRAPPDGSAGILTLIGAGVDSIAAGLSLAEGLRG